MQVPRAVHFRAEDCVDPVRRLCRQHTVVERAGGVDDGCQWMRRWDRCKQPLDVWALRHVACRHSHRRARSFQLRLQRIAAARARAQQQATTAVRRHQVFCDQRAESTGAARDQHGAGGFCAN